MTKVLVCRLDEDPKVEDVKDPFNFCKMSLLEGAHLQAKLIWVKDERVVFYWDEDARAKKTRFNRDVPVVVNESQGGYTLTPDSNIVFDIRGHFLVTKADRKGDHIDLKEIEILLLTLALTLPKCKRCKTKTLAYKGALYCGAACSARAEAGE